MKIAVAALFLIYSTVAWGQSTSLNDVGEVDFANSGSPAAQADFLRGLAQLHNFEYEDAAVHFQEAQKIDPGFTMAYWGEAMTKNHGIWHEQDLSAARKVLSNLGETPESRRAKAPTKREQDYLGCIEILYGEGSKDERDQKYMAAMGRLYQQNPEDIDAAAFYALSILSSAEQGRDFATYMRAAAVLEEVFPKHARHPGVVHYLIHSYDDPIHAPLGLRPARIYSQIAPEAGHAQHMTSHIFLAMGMWEDVVKANETAMTVVNRRREAVGRTPRFCGHYNEWLEYGYLQLGRVADARRVLEGCRQEAENQASDLAKSPKVNSNPNPNTSSIDSYAGMRAHFLINSELWQDELARRSSLSGDFPLAQLTFDYTDALVAYYTSQPTVARQALLRSELDAKLSLALLDQRKVDDPGTRGDIAVLVDQLRALLMSPKPDAAEKIMALQEVAAKEVALPLEFGPPSIYKPTHEILGELYLHAKQPIAAQKAFEVDLARAPGRRLGLQGLTESQRQIPRSTTTEANPDTGSEHVHH